MIIAMDLIRPPWVEFISPRLGRLKVEAFSGNFSDWVQEGLENVAWTDGRAFVSDFLATHARIEQDAPPLGSEIVASLSNVELDDVADLFLAATGVYFRPKYIAAGEGRHRKVRKRREGEVYAMAAAEGEPGADRLLRVVCAWRQDRADVQALFNERTKLTRRDILRQHEALSIVRIIDEQQRFAAPADSHSGLVATIRALQLPVPSGISEILGSSKGLVESIRRLPRSSLPGIVADTHAREGRIRELVGFKPATAFQVPDPLSLYPNIGLNFASTLRATSQFSRATRDLLESVGAYGVTRSLNLGVLADQGRFANSVSRYFDLRIPATTLAAIGALHGASGGTDAILGQSIFPPGFQMAAALGLEARAARGLVADVLHRYGEEVPESPVFTGALESAAIVDADVFTEEEAVTFLQRVAGALLASIRNERDVLQRNGLIGVLFLVIALISGYYTILSLRVSERSLEVAEASLKIAQAQPTNSDLAAVIRESEATRAMFEAQRLEQSDANARIRYVHDRTLLRVEPHAQGIVIRSIYPDQLLRVINENGDWLNVEVFDYQSDNVTRGWISRRRVRLNPAP